MKKYDCEKSRDYAHEFQRMCDNSDCSICPIGKPYCGTINDHHFDSDAAIPIVQKWSDEHPEPHRKTYKEDFFEKFPNAPKDNFDYPFAQRGTIYGGKISYDIGVKYVQWDEEMPEESNNK